MSGLPRRRTALMPAVSRTVLLLGILIMLRGAWPELGALRSTLLESDADDFYGYYTAAWMVRSHQSLALYDAGLHNIDPTEAYAATDSVVSSVARTHGIHGVPLYDYPATLADILVPLTFLSPTVALRIWFAINLAAIAGTALILSRMFRLPTSGAFFWTLAFLMLFRPVLYCIAFAQVSTLLLLLLVAAIEGCTRGGNRTAGPLFALAGAIKLTPLIVLLPLFAWRRWKLMWQLAAWMLAVFVLILAYNGLGSQELYFLHEIPRMGRSLIDPENRGLLNALQVLVHARVGIAPSPGVQHAGEILVLGISIVATILCARAARVSDSMEALAESIAMFLLLAACLAPVSWLHSYTLSAPAVFVSVQRLATARARISEACLFLFFLLTVSSAALLKLEMLSPFAGVALALYQLTRLSRSEALPGADHGQSAIV